MRSWVVDIELSVSVRAFILRDLSSFLKLWRFEYLEKNIKEKNVLDKFTIKGSQLIKPKFSYPGACSGCGETSYLKLISQNYKYIKNLNKIK